MNSKSAAQMATSALALVDTDAERCCIYNERRMRRERVEKLSVDRSMLKAMPLLSWSPEAQSREGTLRQLRADVTIAERVDAWRRLAKYPLV